MLALPGIVHAAVIIRLNEPINRQPDVGAAGVQSSSPELVQESDCLTSLPICQLHVLSFYRGSKKPQMKAKYIWIILGIVPERKLLYLKL